MTNSNPSGGGSQDSIDSLGAILQAKPDLVPPPDGLWESIYATWTGLWTDFHGEWDERQASDVFPISDLLSTEREEWLKQQILAWHNTQLKADPSTSRGYMLGYEAGKREAMAAIPEKLVDVVRSDTINEAVAYMDGWNDAIDFIQANLEKQ